MVDGQVAVLEACDSSDDAQPSTHSDVSLAVFLFLGGISGYLPDSCYAKIELPESPGSGQVRLHSRLEVPDQAITTAWWCVARKNREDEREIRRSKKQLRQQMMINGSEC